MRRFIAAMIFAPSLVSLIVGQTISSSVIPNSDRSPVPIIGHGSFKIKVVRTLESTKMKAGDALEFELVGSLKLRDGTIISKGSLVQGHVVTSTARSKGDADSTLWIRFDHLETTSGRSFLIDGAIQAVFPKPDDPDGGRINALMESGPTFSGEMINGSNPQSSHKPEFVITTKAAGVYGIEDLQLNKGVLASKSKQLKLAKGVRLIVHAQISGAPVK